MASALGARVAKQAFQRDRMLPCIIPFRQGLLVSLSNLGIALASEANLQPALGHRAIDRKARRVEALGRGLRRRRLSDGKECFTGGGFEDHRAFNSCCLL